MRTETLVAFSTLWLIHALIAAALTAFIVWLAWLIGVSIRWRPWELVAFVLPFAIWAIAMVSHGTGKSLANLGECFVISLVIPLAAILRVLIGEREPTWIVPGSLLAGLCGVAFAVYWFMPSLPE